MSQKVNAQRLLDKLRNQRDRLVKKYEAGGEIQYAVAIGLDRIDENGDQKQDAIMSQEALTALGVTAAELFPPDTTAGGTPAIGATVDTTPGSGSNSTEYNENGSKVRDSGGDQTSTDMRAVALNNVVNGKALTMLEALRLRGTGKTVLIGGSASSGSFPFDDVECLIRLERDIEWWPRRLKPFFSDDAQDANVAGAGETTAVNRRGLSRKFTGYTGRQENELNDQFGSIWALKEGNGGLQNGMGFANLIQIYGNNQVIDLNGKNIEFTEAPSRFQGFQALVNMGNGSFNHNTTIGATNATIYCSKGGTGKLGRNNHFSIRCHKSSDLLVENINIGGPSRRDGAYFGSGLYNECSNVVWKNVTQHGTNKRISLSAMGLSHQAEMTLVEKLLGLQTTPGNQLGGSGDSRAFADSSYPWLEWPAAADVNADVGTTQGGDASGTTFNQAFGGKATLRPTIKTGSVSANEKALLLAAQSAYQGSKKNFDDVYIETHHTEGATRGDANNRTRNLNFSSSFNAAEENHYADSATFGFRAGSDVIGVHNLPSSPGGDRQSGIYIIDCTFDEQPPELIEVLSIGKPNDEEGEGGAQFKTGTESSLRMFGASNSFNPNRGLTHAMMLLNGEVVADKLGYKDAKSMRQLSTPSTMPAVDAGTGVVLSGAAQAVANSEAAEAANAGSGSTPGQWTAGPSLVPVGGAPTAFGLYKGNDLLEASLAYQTAARVLAAPGGAGTTTDGGNTIAASLGAANIDAGVLAWRKSCLDNYKDAAGNTGVLSAFHCGLSGGPTGDIIDSVANMTATRADVIVANDGVIFPYAQSKTGADQNADGTLAGAVTDKDGILAGDAANPLPRAGKYVACNLGAPSDATFKMEVFVPTESETNRPALALRLVKALTEVPVLAWEAWATLLGLDPSVGADETTARAAAVAAAGLPVGDPGSTAAENATQVYTIMGNFDGQAHTGKGNFGIRLDQISQFAIIRCNMSGHEITSLPTEKHILGDASVENLSLTASTDRPGSHMTDHNGIALTACTDGVVDGCRLENMEGIGAVTGINIQGKSDNIVVENNTLDHLEAAEVETNAHVSGTVSSYSYPVGLAVATGIRVSPGSSRITLRGNKIGEVENSADSDVNGSRVSVPSKKYSLEGDGTTVE